MAFTELFILGWKTIRKSKLIWLFALLGSISQVFRYIGIDPIVLCVIYPLRIFLFFVGMSGMLIAIYKVEIGQVPTVLEVWQLIRKNWLDFFLAGFSGTVLGMLTAIPSIIIFGSAAYVLVSWGAITYQRSLVMLVFYSAGLVGVVVGYFLVAVDICGIIDKQLKISDAVGQGLGMATKNAKATFNIVMAFWIAHLPAVLIFIYLPDFQYPILITAFYFVLTPLIVAVSVAAYLRFTG
jgi:hypothetical protein